VRTSLRICQPQRKRLQGTAQDPVDPHRDRDRANTRKSGDTQPDYRVLSGAVEVGAGWNRRSETSGHDYVSLSLAAPEFGPRRLYANLGRAAGQDDDDAFAIIWNPAD
jgi:uncharacterized protein (DUF736 family)